MRASLPRSGRRPIPRKPCTTRFVEFYKPFQACNSPLRSENSHFFKWLFTKMAFSVVGGWESGLEPAGISLVMNNAWICFTTSSSSLGNNPSQQNHWIRENRGECSQTCEPTSRVFSSILTRQDLLVADSIFLQCYEAYDHSLSLSSLL